MKVTRTGKVGEDTGFEVLGHLELASTRATTKLQVWGAGIEAGLLKGNMEVKGT